MPSALETRIQRLEAIIQPWKDALRQLRDQIAKLSQQQFGQAMSVSGGGDSSGSVFFADHLNLTGCSAGLLSSHPTPASTTGDVYRVTGGTYFALVATGATILNAMPDATDATMRQILAKNVDGTYVVIGQSCTSP